MTDEVATSPMGGASVRSEREPGYEAGREAAQPEVLRVQNLSLWITAGKSDIQILDDVSFSVRRGERWGIAGESGAGKSMMMSAVSALLPLGSTRMTGSILYRLADGSWQDLANVPVKQRHRFVSERVAFIFQDSIHALNPNERVQRQWFDTIRLHKPQTTPSQCEAHVLAQMEMFGIRGGVDTLRSYPHQLSGGMRQRIAIAMALESQNERLFGMEGAGEGNAGESGEHAGPDAQGAFDGGIIIADEPTTSLDSITQRSVVEHIGRICAQGNKTLLYVSHNMGILQHLCDHLMVMKDGRIVEQGLADDLFFRPKDAYTEKIVRETSKIMGRGEAAWI